MDHCQQIAFRQYLHCTVQMRAAPHLFTTSNIDRCCGPVTDSSIRYSRWLTLITVSSLCGADEDAIASRTARLAIRPQLTSITVSTLCRADEDSSQLFTGSPTPPDCKLLTLTTMSTFCGADEDAIAANTAGLATRRPTASTAAARTSASEWLRHAPICAAKSVENPVPVNKVSLNHTRLGGLLHDRDHIAKS